MEVGVNSDVENDDLICPITHELFRDPVIAADGRVYERDAITRWIIQDGTSPFTRQPLRVEDLQTDDHLRSLATRRRNSTVSYNAREDVVTLPPLRRVPRNNAQVAPLLFPNPTAELRSSSKYSAKCVLYIICCCIVCALIIALPIGLIYGSHSSEPTSKFSLDITTSYSSALTYNSTTFSRTAGGGRYYYQAIQVIVGTTGTYSFTSSSTIDTYGYLYINYFNRSQLSTNMLRADDDSGGGYQFKIENWLQDTSTYILVVTTYSPNAIGMFSIIATGPALVILF